MTHVYPVVSSLCDLGFPVALVCDVLSVSRSAYYEQRQGGVSAHKEEDERLKPMISKVFWDNKRRYGARRIAKALAARDEACGPRRVTRLMQEMELVAIQPKSFRPRTTDSRHTLGYSPNLLLEAEDPSVINQLWVGDITYIPLAHSTFGYAALLMDRCSRRIVGWDIQTNMQESLVLAALQQAIRTRQPESGLIHHTDRGGQYAATTYRHKLEQFKMQQSMSRAANCYDNAFMESCFGTIKTELEMERYESIEIARKELEAYIRYYNTRRLHSSLDYSTPLEFEQSLASAS
jgi:transposase InsO family protein